MIQVCADSINMNKYRKLSAHFRCLLLLRLHTRLRSLDAADPEPVLHQLAANILPFIYIITQWQYSLNVFFFSRPQNKMV